MALIGTGTKRTMAGSSLGHMAANIMFACFGIFTAACSSKEEAPPPEAKTVSYYLGHSEERKKLVSECMAGRVANTQKNDQCGPAMIADQQVARQDYMRSRGINPDH